MVIYWSISYIFLKYPLLLHQKKNKLKLPPKKDDHSHYILAHRGGSVENPENTLQAFKHALEQGVQFLETDLRLTKDGILMTLHDDNFNRLSNVNKKVEEMNYKDQPKILDEIPMHFTKDYKLKLTEKHDKSFTTLEQLFSSIPSEIVVQIELKDQDNFEQHRKTVELIQKYKRQATTIIGVQKDVFNRQLHSLDPSIPKFVSMSNAIKYLGAYVVGLLPFIDIYEDVASLPFMTRDFHKMRINESQSFTKYFFIYGVKFFNIVSEPFLRHLNARGIFTNYWVLNEEDEFQYLTNSCVQGIMTDKPSMAVRILKENSMKHQKKQQ
ncbi:glycerophosphodiester phosphodiesterase domain-containing protein 1-like [Stylonychia lemnae]|uniref:Glycerophosphodiester phosphodiesterase domain-containing protein 1-like n=1 Tax=Stylonychia lemnae TaxID=5949 RepID=A0A077ZP53_STYLE|nr:glycerophosphodiester phosphodiesterase domain-containing protein 1-like [Stylonychia lemnae]|eukprot:CDW71239.1 glycerophosphodiester phosphodiesterase domain-containing protein 1-like [Stylonychia lemnae]